MIGGVSSRTLFSSMMVSSRVGTGIAGRISGDDGLDLETEVVGMILEPRIAIFWFITGRMCVPLDAVSHDFRSNSVAMPAIQSN